MHICSCVVLWFCAPFIFVQTSINKRLIFTIIPVNNLYWKQKSFSSGQPEVSPAGRLQPVTLSPTVSEEPRLLWPSRLDNDPFTRLSLLTLGVCLTDSPHPPAHSRTRASSLLLPSRCTSPTTREELSAQQTSWLATVSHSRTENPGLCIAQGRQHIQSWQVIPVTDVVFFWQRVWGCAAEANRCPSRCQSGRIRYWRQTTDPAARLDSTHA